MKIIFAFILLLGALEAYSSQVQVLSYNLGQLHKQGVDLVPCTRPRLSPQVDAIFGKQGLVSLEKPFVLALQEVWTKRAYGLLKRQAELWNLEMFPLTQREASVTGTVLMTNLPVSEFGFEKFSRNKYLPKGILHASMRLDDGSQLTVADVHTGYSDSRSFSLEHKTHINDIKRFVHERSFTNEHFVIAGDFNAGADMAFIKQRYDPAARIWYQTLMPAMMGAGLHEASEGVGPTWDTRNPLVTKPALAIRAMNGLIYHTWKWEEKTATLDHVFASEGLRTQEAKLVLNERKKLDCPRRDGGRDLSYLSDHYGILVALETEKGP